MATTPDNPNEGGKPGKTKPKRDLEQEMLMREVDEAVRTDQVSTAFQKYGLPVGVALVLALSAFAGFLYWQSSGESELETQSEQLIGALDEADAGNLALADEEMALLSEEASPGAMAVANLTRAGIALQEDRVSDAVVFYDRVANNADAPQPLRDIAAIRSVSAQFDELDPQAVIDRIGSLATPDNAWFGSAGELVAMAYLAQEREDLAGPLLVQISQDENVPQTLRSRTRQLAGLLGYDAVEDVEETLAELRGDSDGISQDAAQ